MAAIPSENAILESINRRFENAREDLALGRGDDCAIFQSNGQFCVSTDLFLENIHFRCDYFEPEEIGHKALAVNVSDLAAMGAKPLAFQLGLGLPDDLSLPWLGRLFDGMANLANKKNIFLSGGDISRSPFLHISISVFGSSIDDWPLLRRGGVMPGDKLFVIGQLGLARTGLINLEKSGRSALGLWPAACKAHLTPVPRIAAGMMLARVGRNARPPALMDVSDGLARDLPRLLGESCGHAFGAKLEIPDAMLHPEVLSQAFREGLEPFFLAYLGGEDYALLGACAPDLEPSLHAAIPDFCCIGEVTAESDIICNGQNMSRSIGFDHFQEVVTP